MQWKDGLFDLAFAENNSDIIIAASGDGTVQLWNQSAPQVVTLFPT